MKTIILFLALTLSLTSFAQKKNANSLLWEISGNGLSQPSYLFGTIHIICKEDYFMPDVVKQKFAASQNIFLEMDMDDPKMQMTMMKLATLPAGENLKKIFGKDYAMADSFFKAKAGMGLALFNQFKPMMVMSLLYLKMLPCQNTESYETNFMAMAKTQKKDIKGLETIEDQMQVFDNIPDSVEAANIIKMIKEFDAQEKQFADMVRVYKQQNISKLYASVSSSPDLMEAEDDLLKKRNSNWIPVMEKNMKEGSSFFAVGAAHLGGDIGVIALLRKAGYKVRAVKAQ
ncbi:MAG: TraB/GumN family protein [Chitinophagaceae bacterium]|nr:TraB/GumN family protein [Chitinophagaceae bacterium]